jgi:hypothetical protein
MLHDKMQELEIELEDSNTDREKESIVNQIETLKCVLDHLHGEKVRAVKIVETNNNFQAINPSKKTVKLNTNYRVEISTQIQST